ncbi:MAG: hypothetical protein NDJ72_06670 [Elusimicrobia bacterium]|nr:hypothetical protein [Elusimicrobiota bacterium]
MKTLLLLSAVLCAVPAAAQDDKPLGMISGLDPAKVCNIDGPVDKAAVNSMIVRRSQTGQRPDGSFQLLPKEKQLYCQIAEQTAFMKLGAELSRKMKGETVKPGNTYKWDKYVKLYATNFCSNWTAQAASEREWTKAEQTELRLDYAVKTAAYVAGAKTASEKNDAIDSLSWVNQYGTKDCKEWLEEEKKLIAPAIEAALSSVKK